MALNNQTSIERLRHIRQSLTDLILTTQYEELKNIFDSKNTGIFTVFRKMLDIDILYEDFAPEDITIKNLLIKNICHNSNPEDVTRSSLALLMYTRDADSLRFATSAKQISATAEEAKKH